MREPQPLQAKPPVRVWRRVWIALACVVALTAALAFIGNRYDRARTAAALQSIIERLDEEDPNWRLADIEAGREQIPEEENGARLVVAVAGRLPKGWPRQAVAEQLDLGYLPAPERLDKQREGVLAAEIKALAGIVADARPLADLPRGRFNVTHAFNPIATLLPDVQESRRVAALLRYDALDLAYKGDIDAALRSCRAALNVGRAAGDEPIVITQMVRCSNIQQAILTAERVLAQGEASDKALADLQALLSLEDGHPTLRIARRGGRATLYDLCDKLASGRLTMDQMRKEFNARRPDLWQQWFAEKTSRGDQEKALRVMTQAVEATRLPESDQAAEERRLDAELGRLKFDPLVTALMSPEVSRFGITSRRKQALVRSLLVLAAVERFRLRRGKWPDKLEEVTPNLLPALPVDPYNGKPLRYKKVKDGVLVYSVGEDGSDDGGNVVPALSPETAGIDQGVRLWNVEARRQAASPRPPSR